MTLCPNEREVPFKFCVHLFGRTRRHSVFSSFNCNLFSIIQYLTSEIIIMVIFKCYFSREHLVLSYKKWFEHRIRKNQQINSISHEGRSYMI